MKLKNDVISVMLYTSKQRTVNFCLYQLLVESLSRNYFVMYLN